MKKPSLKRKKQPTPQQLATAPASKKSGRRGKKALTPQELATAPAQAKKVKRSRGRGPFGKLGRPLRLLGKPVGKLAGLRGRTRVVVYALLAIVLVFAVLQLRGGGDDQQEVRDALATYERASRDKDYQTLCDDLLASSYVKQTASSGLPCEVALRTALEDVRNPTLQVLGVEVNGDRAAARVRGSAAGQVPGEANYTLVREDDAWRILPPRSDSAGATP